MLVESIAFFLLSFISSGLDQSLITVPRFANWRVRLNCTKDSTDHLTKSERARASEREGTTQIDTDQYQNLKLDSS